MTSSFVFSATICLVNMALMVHGLGQEGLLSEVMVPPIKVCPQGFVESGKTCIFEHIEERSTICPKSARLENDLCVTETEVKMMDVCPEGYVQENHKCARAVTIEGTIVCPKGHVLTEDVCISSKESRPVHRCPIGYKMDYETNECSKEVKIPSEKHCPDGMKPGIKGCKKLEVTQMEESCFSGDQLEGNVCVKKVIVPAQEITTQTEPTQLCPPGTLEEKGKCVSTESSAPMMKCRKDFELENGICIKIVSEEPDLLCDYGAHLKDGYCMKTKIQNPSFSPGENATLVDGYYKTVKSVDAPLQCPEGARLVGNECITTTVTPVLRSCPNGFKEDGNDMCIKESYVEPEKTCFPNTERKGLFCFKYVTAKPEIECKRGELDLVNTVCTETSEAQPIVLCPKYFKHIEGSSWCSKKKYASAGSVCPSHSITKGSKCITIEMVNAIPCAEGYTSEPRGCVRREERMPQYGCHKNYKLLHGMCFPKKRFDHHYPHIFDWFR